jgi:molybdopterin-containing oxidoreductase family membrane subunit
MFSPTWVDVGVFVGSIGVFFTLFLLFLRVLPSIAIAEVKMILKSSSEQSKMKLIKEGNLDKEHVQEYIESLEKFDSVKQEDYAKI